MSIAALSGTVGAERRGREGLRRECKRRGTGREIERRGMDKRLTFHVIPIDGDIIKPLFHTR